MNPLASIVFLVGTTAAVTAQSPLTTLFAGTNQTAPGGQVCFDLAVTTTVTIRALDVNLSTAPGVNGTIEIYTTIPSVTTYFGNETSPSQWSPFPVASGTVKAAGANQPSYVCLTSGLVLQPGTIGVVLRHIECQPWYSVGNGTTQPGGGAPTTNQTFSTPQLTLLAGAVQGVPWNAPTQPRVWNGSLHYAVGAVAHACAINTNYGPGCYQQQTSFFQMFSTSAEASLALSGRSLSLLNTNPGYTVLNNAPGVAFVPPSGTASAFAVDDGELNYAWPSATPFGPGGPTSLFVHTNGIVSTASNAVLTPNAYRANVAGCLNANATAWWSWHDYNPAAVGSGLIRMEEVAGVVYVTWDNVESYPTATVNPSRWQFQFDLASGNVNYVWVSITALGQSLYGDSHVIGYSPGGPSLALLPIDLTTFTSVSVGAVDLAPLTLTATTRPAIGSVVTYTTSNPTSVSLGINFLSVADLGPFSPAGLDLTFIGIPGCVANVDINQGIGNVIANLGLPFPGMAVAFPIPVNLGLVGQSVYSQSVWLDAAANAGGLLTSNAIRSLIGTF